MRKRTQSRDFCLQVLFQIEFTKETPDEALELFWGTQEKPVDDDIRAFAEELVRGVCGSRQSLDEHIAGLATNWKLDRMAVLDRNILRLGCYELMCRHDIPPKVAINEAVELAKRYSGVKAGQFVNGILDKVKAAAEQEKH